MQYIGIGLRANNGGHDKVFKAVLARKLRKQDEECINDPKSLETYFCCYRRIMSRRLQRSFLKIPNAVGIANTPRGGKFSKYRQYIAIYCNILIIISIARSSNIFLFIAGKARNIFIYYCLGESKYIAIYFSLSLPSLLQNMMINSPVSRETIS